jgi:hypothetical protein
VPQTILKAREDALAKLQSLGGNDLEAYLSTIFPGDTLLMSKIIDVLTLVWLGSVPEIRDSKRKGQKRGQIKRCQTFMNLYGLLLRSTVLRELYSVVTPYTGE